MTNLARNSDPITSHLAAEQALKFKDSHGDRIIEALLQHGPMTVHEIGPFVGLEAHAVGKRMHELCKHGHAFVAQFDQHDVLRSTPTGGKARVYVGVV
jgi:predicted ArsR family transcriptional regulator